MDKESMNMLDYPSLSLSKWTWERTLTLNWDLGVRIVKKEMELGKL